MQIKQKTNFEGNKLMYTVNKFTSALFHIYIQFPHCVTYLNAHMRKKSWHSKIYLSELKFRFFHFLPNASSMTKKHPNFFTAFLKRFLSLCQYLPSSSNVDVASQMFINSFFFILSSTLRTKNTEVFNTKVLLLLNNFPSFKVQSILHWVN